MTYVLERAIVDKNKNLNAMKLYVATYLAHFSGLCKSLFPSLFSLLALLEEGPRHLDVLKSEPQHPTSYICWRGGNEYIVTGQFTHRMRDELSFNSEGKRLSLVRSCVPMEMRESICWMAIPRLSKRVHA